MLFRSRRPKPIPADPHAIRPYSNEWYRLKDASYVEDTLAEFPQKHAALLNHERSAIDRDELDVDAGLMESARRKAEDMATRGYYGHEDPDGRAALYMVHEAGVNFREWSENIWVTSTKPGGQPLAMVALTAFRNSTDGHWWNAMRPDWTRVGVGIARGSFDGTEHFFIVQHFAD